MVSFGGLSEILKKNVKSNISKDKKSLFLSIHNITHKSNQTEKPNDFCAYLCKEKMTFYPGKSLDGIKNILRHENITKSINEKQNYL